MHNPTILIASDHVGFELKLHLLESLSSKISFTDLGPSSTDRCNYNDYAALLSSKIRASNEFTHGILICGTGVGMSIAANRHQGIRAVVCSEPYSAIMSRKHNDSNILCLGSRVLGTETAKFIILQWLNTEFDDGRHSARLSVIDTYR